MLLKKMMFSGFSLFLGLFAACSNNQSDTLSQSVSPTPVVTPTESPVSDKWTRLSPTVAPTSSVKFKPDAWAGLTSPTAPPPPVDQAGLEAEIRRHLTIPKGKWTWQTFPMTAAERESWWNKIRGYSDNMYVSFTIYNKSDYAVKDFTVSFRLYGNSGTAIQTITSDPIYEIVPAKGKKFIRALKIGAVSPSVSSATCEVEDFSIVTKH